MARHPTSMRLSERTEAQIKQLSDQLSIPRSSIISLAIDRLHHQETRNMNTQERIELTGLQYTQADSTWYAYREVSPDEGAYVLRRRTQHNPNEYEERHIDSSALMASMKGIAPLSDWEEASF